MPGWFSKKQQVSLAAVKAPAQPPLRRPLPADPPPQGLKAVSPSPTPAQAASQPEQFDANLNNLVAMFPQLDTEIVALVYQSNHGQSERTVEQLLQLDGSGTSVNASRAEGSGDAPAQPPVVPQDRLPVATPAEHHVHSQPMASPVATFANANFIGMLPADFLMPPSYFATRSSGSLASQQALQDELIARALVEHPEWFDESEDGKEDSQSGVGAAAGTAVPPQALRDKLSRMGFSARTRLRQMAVRFSRKHSEIPSPARERPSEILVADSSANLETPLLPGSKGDDESKSADALHSHPPSADARSSWLSRSKPVHQALDDTSKILEGEEASANLYSPPPERSLQAYRRSGSLPEDEFYI